ncbi:helix-turn-helix domain-containing protein [Salibaculum sp.]|uniref:arsenate reductase/protein-tyrosine-phosphatase family protein n=1 Tax=Salibaculum sp. TaxID=2855480 RepID=UPI002B462D04|nr:helix-turn-helix domain-containing protein [Salibaculum sp.]HKL69963.1 helix-turn-helix domain-containing protein [Salibaculum sp.]
MEMESPARLATLGHPQRLAIYRLLMRRYPDRVPAQEIAQAIEAQPSTTSAYLSALSRAGLISQQRDGTSLRYTVEMEVAQRLFDDLFLDCCRGRVDLCLTGQQRRPAMSPETDRKYRVLFLCTGNSARSIFAESILRHTAGDRFEAWSAGTTPNSELNPFAVEVLDQKGHDTNVLRAKHMSEFQAGDAPGFDFVFTVCNQAANEDCPAWDGQPVSAHWGLPDPVKVEGTDAEKSLAFQNTYGALQRRIAAFTALPIRELGRMSLQQAVDDIGQTKDDT